MDSATLERTTVVGKWGNSQAVRLSKEACDLCGIALGDEVGYCVDPVRRTITIMPAGEAAGDGYRRTRRMTAREFARGFEGDRIGEEWGGPDVGAEVVE